VVPETHRDASEGGTFQFRRKRLGCSMPTFVKWRYSGPADDWAGIEIVFRLEWRHGQTFVLFSHEGLARAQRVYA
jgi:hypothetical protein